MRKHMTNSESLRIMKLLRNGVTDMAEIQSQVFVHADCIKQVALKFKKQTTPKRGSKKKEEVDPIT